MVTYKLGKSITKHYSSDRKKQYQWNIIYLLVWKVHNLVQTDESTSVKQNTVQSTYFKSIKMTNWLHWTDYLYPSIPFGINKV